MCNAGHSFIVDVVYCSGTMVESNHDEERLARTEHMVESLQREMAALKAVRRKCTAVVAVVATHAPEAVTVLADTDVSRRHMPNFSRR
jgi:hypothetical protein